MEYRLPDLLNIPKIQELTDSFFAATGIPAAVVTNDGTVLVKSGWQAICLEFHRKNPQSEMTCIKSAMQIRERLKDRKRYAIYQCPNGLIDAAAPIVVAGEHLANVMTGQLLFSELSQHEINHFRGRAQEFGFDENSYLDALSEVPIIPRVKVERSLAYLSKFAELLAEMGLTHLKQIEASEELKDARNELERKVEERTNQLISTNEELEEEVANRKRAEKALQETKRELETIIDSVPACIAYKDRSNRYIRINKTYADSINLSRQAIEGKSAFDISSNRELARAYWRDDKEVIESGIPKRNIIEPCIADEKKWIQTDKIPYRDVEGNITGVIAFFTDITARLQAEEALRESEERYRSLFQNNHAVMLLIDPETKHILDANPAACAFYGYSKAEITKKKTTDINLLAEDQLLRETQEAISGKRQQFFFRHRLANGEVRDVEAYGGPIKVKGKKLLYSIIHDISDRTRAEGALRESEERYRNVVENSIQGILIHQDSIIRFANQAAAAIFGYDKPEEIVGRDVWETSVDPEHWDELQGRIRTLVEGKPIPIHHGWRGIRKDGTRIWVQSTANLIRWQGQHAVLGFYIDITARKYAVEELRNSEERYRTLVESSSDAILMMDKERNIVSCNQAFLELFGYDLDECLGQSIGIIHPSEESFLSFGKTAYPVIEKSGTFRTEWEFQKKDGTACPVEAVTSAVKAPDESLRGYAAIIRDITDRRRAEAEKDKLEAQLQRAEKMEAIGTLAGGVAHDLNNILSGIVSYPDLLLLQLPEGSPLRKPILTVQESGKKAATIVQDLLTLARRGVAISEIVNINDTVSEYLRSPEYQRLKLYHPEIEVETALEANLLNIEGSPVHLSKTIMNLGSNAAESIDQKGWIFISTENRYIDRPIKGYDHLEEGDYVALRISDTGSGMSSEDLQRIFEPFYSKKIMGRSGTGLGMAVVWGTVKDHKGYIDVQSTPGEGTTFTLYFPVTRKKPAIDQSALSMESCRGNGEAILVVDDVKEQREIAFRLLTESGYTVTTVSSGEEAIEYMTNNTADLVVLDMIMAPGIDGLDTYKGILGLHPGQKAIITSGFSETDRVKAAQKLGASAYLRKPYLMKPYLMKTIGLLLFELHWIDEILRFDPL